MTLLLVSFNSVLRAEGLQADMERVEKTVFISYRRVNFPWALAVWQELAHHGYDVFIDYDGIGSGDFESVILENIPARAHFVIILTPSALERCHEPGDLMRREIEIAITNKRNIVSLMLEGFSFGTPAIAQQLTGSLSPVKKYNALSVPNEYFHDAMKRLREKFLDIPLTAVIHPSSVAAQLAASAQNLAAEAAPPVQEQELTAQQYFERAFDSSDPDEQFRFYSEAIRLTPSFPVAYYNRAFARRAKGDRDGMLEDWTEAIRLDPDLAEAYQNRGSERRAKDDLDGAIDDYTEVIRLRLNDPNSYVCRGNVYGAKGDWEKALSDYGEALRLKPDYGGVYHAYAHTSRGLARQAAGDLDGAIDDYSAAIQFDPNYVVAYSNRGEVYQANGEQDLARDDYDEAIRLDPGYAAAYYNRGMLFLQMAQPEFAISDLLKYLALGIRKDYGTKEEVEKTISELKEKL